MKEIDFLQDKILKELDSLISHLDKYEEKHWSDYFRKIQRLIDNGDFRAIDSLNSIRGGMGSYKDLVICKMNKHKIEQHEEVFANTELLRLGGLVLRSADKLKRLIYKKI